MNLNKGRKNESEQSQETDKSEEVKYKEKASHPAEERGAAHVTPALRRPFFVLRPPWRALTMGKGRVRFHKIIKNSPVVE